MKREDLSLDDFIRKEEDRISTSEKWRASEQAYERLLNKHSETYLNSHDPRYNSLQWAFDVCRLCKEISFSYCRMNAHAEFYKQTNIGVSCLSNADFHVSYYADNCIIRIDSCVDKLALMVWAFYCAFNPGKRDEILTYNQILDRLRHPVKFALKIENKDDFLHYLEKLGGEDFKKMEKYRHLKIHRREPRIEIFGEKSCHGWEYTLPVNKEDEPKWKKELDNELPPPVREGIIASLYYDGIPYRKTKIEDSTWDYEEVHARITNCMNNLLEVCEGCFRTLDDLLSGQDRASNARLSKKPKPPLIALDSDAFSFFVYAIYDGTKPDYDNAPGNILKQRIALVRIFLYSKEVAYIPQTVRAQLKNLRTAHKEASNGPNFDFFVTTADALFQNVPQSESASVSERVNIYSRMHRGAKNEADCRILAEAELGGMEYLLTYDDEFIKKLQTKTHIIKIMRPSVYWEHLKIPRGQPPVRTPHASNKMSEASWWIWR